MTAIGLSMPGFLSGLLGAGSSGPLRSAGGRGVSADRAGSQRRGMIADPAATRRRGQPGWSGAATAELAAERVVNGRTDDRSDEALLRDYLHGDRAAFREVMDRYRHELLHFLIRFLGSRAAAEDVFQETFLQIHLSADTFDVTRRFKPWLFTIAANKARDFHRKNLRRGAVSLSAAVGDEEGETFVDLLEAGLPGPTEPLLDAERSSMVKAVLDRLPSHLREIIVLSYFQRMSYNQIAEVLRIPLGTVKSRLHAAVAAFARDWKAVLARERAAGPDQDLPGSTGGAGESKQKEPS